MKSKTSITLSPSIISEIDSLANLYKSRSDFIEQAILDYISKIKRLQREKLDIDIINKKFKTLNKESEDVLDYQVAL